jgi:heat shock protein HtpX
MITNPLADHGLGILFRTHPPTADRIRRLHQLARRPTR